MNINPCIWDLKWMSENSGAPSVDSNITFPRPGTWDSATRTFTFSGGNAAAYPLEKIKIEEPLTVGGKSTSFSCDSGAGWYGKSMTDSTATSDQIGNFNPLTMGNASFGSTSFFNVMRMRNSSYFLKVRKSNLVDLFCYQWIILYNFLFHKWQNKRPLTYI